MQQRRIYINLTYITKAWKVHYLNYLLLPQLKYAFFKIGFLIVFFLLMGINFRWKVAHIIKQIFLNVLNDKKYLLAKRLVNSERAVILCLGLQIHVWHELSKSSNVLLLLVFLLLSCQAQQYWDWSLAPVRLRVKLLLHKHPLINFK